MNKLIVTLIGGLLAVSAQAQNQAKPQPEGQSQRSATSPAIGQAVSGHNATAAGVSGTGLRTDGGANTGSAQTGIAEQAAGVNAAGKVTGKSTSVIGAAPGKSDNVNANATNTTSPNNTDPNPAASGGRGKAGTKAEQEIRKSNTTAVTSPPGSHVKSAAGVKRALRKREQVREKSDRKSANRAAGGDTENR